MGRWGVGSVLGLLLAVAASAQPGYPGQGFPGQLQDPRMQRPAPQSRPQPRRQAPQVNNDSQLIQISPSGAPASVEERFRYVKQELKLRSQAVLVFSSPNDHRQFLAQNGNERLLQIRVGEIKVLARRALLIPGHMISNVDYSLNVDQKNQRIWMFVTQVKPALTLGYLEFSSKGEFLQQHHTDEGKQVILAEQEKEIAAGYKTNVQLWEAELRSLIPNPQGWNNQMSLDVEGQIEFLTKEIFGIRNKRLELVWQPFSNHSNQTILSFTDKVTKQPYGSIGLYIAKNGAPFVSSIAATHGNRNSLQADFEKFEAAQQPTPAPEVKPIVPPKQPEGPVLEGPRLTPPETKAPNVDEEIADLEARLRELRRQKEGK